MEPRELSRRGVADVEMADAVLAAANVTPTAAEDVEMAPPHARRRRRVRMDGQDVDDAEMAVAGAAKTRRAPHVMRYLRAREVGQRPGEAERQAKVKEWAEWVSIRTLEQGKYLTLDRIPSVVRSTISIAFSADGKLFASTHGDHSVKIFSYPSGTQITSLEQHPRTPWTVHFHPHDSNIVASGCLGNECRVWNIRTGECFRKHRFHASISCVSFHPDGDFLAITSGKSLMLWEYERVVDDEGKPVVPVRVLEGDNPFHMVAFHPSGNFIMAGEKNKHPHIYETQFTLKLWIHRFDARAKRLGSLFLEVPRAVAYNDAGIHFSPCGSMLAACVPHPKEEGQFHIAVISLVENDPSRPVGSLVFSGPIDQGRVTGLTNLKFSSTSRFLLAGFSFRRSNPVLRYLAESYETIAERDGRGPQVRVVDVYRVEPGFSIVKSLMADVNLDGAEDEINVAGFAPGFGSSDGIVYGTQKGRIRLFHRDNRSSELASSSRSKASCHRL